MSLTALAAVLLAGAAVACLAWLGQGFAQHVLSIYRQRFTRHAHQQLEDVFLFLDPSQLWRLNLAACVAVITVSYVLTREPVVAVGMGAAALIFPVWFSARLRRRRAARFDSQLPDLLLALAGALRSGAGLQQALRQIVQRSPSPLAQEFGLVLKEQRVGVTLDQALAGLGRRMPTEGAVLVISALTIAMHTGGNLAETLERIGHTLRARLHLLGRIDALTSQGRLQAWIMAALPMLLAFVLNYLEPDAMALMWSTPAGWSIMGLIILLEVIGVWLIRRIVNIRV
jgi:tight adherence protein B